MPDQDAPVCIAAADHTSDQVVVAFGNGIVVTYSAPFLFSMRDQDHNRVIATEPDPPRVQGQEPAQDTEAGKAHPV